MDVWVVSHCGFVTVGFGFVFLLTCNYACQIKQNRIAKVFAPVILQAVLATVPPETDLEETQKNNYTYCNRILFFRGENKPILLLCLERQSLRRVVIRVYEIKHRRKALIQQGWGPLPQLHLKTNKINQYFVKGVRHIRNLLIKVLEPCMLSFPKEHSFSLLCLFSSHPNWWIGQRSLSQENS